MNERIPTSDNSPTERRTVFISPEDDGGWQ